jgi:hypothetical protein
VSFEVRRDITAAATAAPCPHGHPETSRVFSAVSVMRGGTATAYAPAQPAAGGGGCCGGACGCG